MELIERLWSYTDSEYRQCLMFGKYKCVPIEKVPDSYLRFVASEPVFSKIHDVILEHIWVRLYNGEYDQEWNEEC